MVLWCFRLSQVKVVGERRADGGELALLRQRRSPYGGLSAWRTMRREGLALLESGDDFVVDGDLARADKHADPVRWPSSSTSTPPATRRWSMLTATRFSLGLDALLDNPN
jgi:hypothetical protein